MEKNPGVVERDLELFKRIDLLKRYEPRPRKWASQPQPAHSILRAAPLCSKRPCAVLSTCSFSVDS